MPRVSAGWRDWIRKDRRRAPSRLSGQWRSDTRGQELGGVRRPLRQGWGVRVGMSTYLREGRKDCSALIPETSKLSALDSREVKTLCP